MKPRPKPIVRFEEPDTESLLRRFNADVRPLLGETFNGAGTGRDGEADGWINGLRLKRFYRDELDDLPLNFRFAIDKVRRPEQQVVQALFNVMEVGTGDLKRHIDGAPYFDRWHLVLQTSGSEYWQEDQGYVMMEQGYWYGPISYWIPHSMRNVGDTERIHMIVDLEPRA